QWLMCSVQRNFLDSRHCKRGFVGADGARFPLLKKEANGTRQWPQSSGSFGPAGMNHSKNFTLSLPSLHGGPQNPQADRQGGAARMRKAEFSRGSRIAATQRKAHHGAPGAKFG